MLLLRSEVAWDTRPIGVRGVCGRWFPPRNAGSRTPPILLKKVPLSSTKKKVPLSLLKKKSLSKIFVEEAEEGA